MKYLVEVKIPKQDELILRELDKDSIPMQCSTDIDDEYKYPVILAEISETDFNESINELESLVKVYQNDIDMKYLVESAVPKVQIQINNLQSAISILKHLST